MKLFYRKMGAGKPVVILHGLFGLSDNWLTVGKALAENFSVYLVDLRNHGQSPHSTEFSYEVMSRDLAGLLDYLQLTNASIIGHSMGGKAAMQFAIDYPKRADKLIVADIGPKYYPSHHAEIIDALLSIDTVLLKSRKEAEEKLSLKISDGGVRQFLMKNLYWKEKDKLGWRMNLSVIAEKIAEVGKAQSVHHPIPVPVLFVRGEKSSYIQEEDRDFIARLFSVYSIETIGEAGHWVHADQPVMFVNAVNKFLKN